jgi:hypothetical protein
VKDNKGTDQTKSGPEGGFGSPTKVAGQSPGKPAFPGGSQTDEKGQSTFPNTEVRRNPTGHKETGQAPPVRGGEKGGTIEKNAQSGSETTSRTIGKNAPSGSETTSRTGADQRAEKGGRLGAVSEGLGIVTSLVDLVRGTPEDRGAVIFTSDRITYPRGLEMAGPQVRRASARVARFFSVGQFADDEVTIMVVGDFGEIVQETNTRIGVLANLKLEIDRQDTVLPGTIFGTRLEFTARAEETFFGTPTDPKVRFQCSGRFDASGIGDDEFTALIEVDRFCRVNLIDGRKITAGAGVFRPVRSGGFEFQV